MVSPLAGGVLAFHIVKLTGLAVNTVAFPVLSAARRAGTAGVSLLVPARDEAVRLPETLPGLLAQPVEEILVLDDGSRDNTSDVVTTTASGDPRLRLVAGRPAPAGWVGKNWACQQLADAARGDRLVFCDADVHLAPGAVAAVVGEMHRQRASVLSVFPRQRTESLGERLTVPLIDEVLLSFLPYPLLRLPISAAACANGQLMAFDRAGYDRIGGHASVAGELVEDLALARRVRRLGLRLGLALGGDAVQARLYRGYGEAVAGFAKSLRGAHFGSRALLAANLAGHAVAYTLPWLRWSSGPAWRAAALAGLLERALVNAKTGRRQYAEVALVPIVAPAVVPAVLAAMRRRVRWKGRDYP
ncbi:glycosyltransferase [Actinocatenispora sera]|uniref:glycosyltransferase n=1 Tax=Actinocatenispora sera TaxID=390989 RepID=UPI0033EF9C25